MKKRIILPLLLGLTCLLAACGSTSTKEVINTEVSHDNLIDGAEIYKDNYLVATASNAHFDESNALIVDIDLQNLTSETVKVRFDRLKINDFALPYTDTVEIEANGTQSTSITVDISAECPFIAANVGDFTAYISTWVSNRIGVGGAACDTLAVKDSYQPTDVSEYQLVYDQDSYQIYYCGLIADSNAVENSTEEYLVYNNSKKMGDVSVYDSSSDSEASSEVTVPQKTYAYVHIDTGSDQSDATSFEWAFSLDGSTKNTVTVDLTQKK